MNSSRRALRFFVLLFVLVVGFVFSGCTVSPVADGGTHTGNPDITACASALSDIAALQNEWDVRSYVDSQSLDPAYIDPVSSTDPAAPYQGGLSKRAAPGDSTSIDTILVYDTLFVNDTTYRQRIVADTVDTLLGADTLVYVNRWLVVDTMVATDTAVLVDTIVVTEILPAGMVVPGGDTSDNTSYDVFYDTTRANRMSGEAVVDPAKFTSIPGSLSDVISRSGFYVTPSGTSVFVEYADADGDNLLFTALPGTVPRAYFDERRLSPTSGRYLHATFSAGADKNFSLRGDNAVLSLSRYRLDGEDTTESATYLTSWSGAVAADSAKLTLKKYSPSDSVFSTSTRFSIWAGANTASLSDDRLASLTRTILYRRGELDKIVLTVSPASPLAVGSSLGTASFTAIMDFVDGNSTTMQGTVGAEGEITGTYTDAAGTTSVQVGSDGNITLGR